jgi:hypothetical protein
MGLHSAVIISLNRIAFHFIGVLKCFTVGGIPASAVLIGMANQKRKQRGRSKKLQLVRSPKMDVLATSRVVQLGIIAKTAADAGAGRNWQLSQMPNFAEYTALFNEYRITSIEITYDLSTSLLNSPTAYPRLAFCVDINDSGSPIQESDLLQYQDVRVLQMSQVKTQFKHRFVPRVALAAYQGAFSGYSTAPAGQWLNTDNSNVQHYGTKEWLTNYNTTATPNTIIVLYAVFHMEFRRPR